MKIVQRNYNEIDMFHRSLSSFVKAPHHWIIYLLLLISYFQMTYSPWPTSPYHVNFYKEYISGRSYESYYSFLQDKSSKSTSPGEKQSHKEVISQNFLGVQLFVDQQLMMEYTARPQLSLPSFLSQLGGTLNLWAGITVVIIIEILELGYRVLADCRKSKSRTETNIISKDIELMANQQKHEWV